MTHRFPVKEIALQAGTSTATVDRVLHGRPNVSPQTRKRVQDALRELEGQEEQLAARGRRMFVDVVVEAPARFSREIRRAVEAELPSLRPAVVRPRYTFHELMTEDATVAALARIGSRGSQGVLLKARDGADVRKSVEALTARRIPVVTIFTDIPNAARIAYAGIDNESAGETAAYLIDTALPPAPGAVLMTRSNEMFHGEEARAVAFAEAIARRTDLRLIDVSGGAGLDRATATEIQAAIAQEGKIRAVYSMGGGNRAILDTLERSGKSPEVFIAHDLDTDNIRLLEELRIQFVLHDDLRRDINAALQHVLAFYRLLDLPEPPRCSDVVIVTPMNWAGRVAADR